MTKPCRCYLDNVRANAAFLAALLRHRDHRRSHPQRLKGLTMNESYTTGVWPIETGRENAFVEAWTGLAPCSLMPGAGALRLSRDLGDPHQFVGFGLWSSREAAHAWNSCPGFRERMACVVQHVAAFSAAELEVIAVADAGVLVAAEPRTG